MDAEQLYGENVMLKERSRKYRERSIAQKEQLREAAVALEALREDVGVARRERNEMMAQCNIRLGALHVAQRELAQARRHAEALRAINARLVDELRRLNRQLNEDGAT
jgi:hypothetical protein